MALGDAVCNTTGTCEANATTGAAYCTNCYSDLGCGNVTASCNIARTTNTCITDLIGVSWWLGAQLKTNLGTNYTTNIDTAVTAARPNGTCEANSTSSTICKNCKVDVNCGNVSASCNVNRTTNSCIVAVVNGTQSLNTLLKTNLVTFNASIDAAYNNLTNGTCGINSTASNYCIACKIAADCGGTGACTLN